MPSFLCSVNSILNASGNFCHVLTTFANSLDPDRDENVGPDQDPNRLTL